MEIILFPLSSLLIFLVFTEIITVRFKGSLQKEIDVNFMIVGIRFIRRREGGGTSKGKGQKKKIPFFKKFVATNKSLLYLIKRSEVEIERFDVYQRSVDPAADVLKRGVLSSSISSFLCIAEKTAKKLNVNNINLYLTDNNKTVTEYDVKLTFSLLTGLAAASIFLYNLIFTKAGNIKYVGWENE